MNQNGSYCSAEGLCGANLCYADGHCSAMFNPDSWVFGIGFEPFANGITISYISPGNYKVNHSIANVCHFDERIKINSESYDSDAKYLTFLLQWWNKSESVNRAYLVYDGNITQMELGYGNENNGFFKINMPV